MGGPHSWAQMLGSTVDLIAGEHPVESVSPYVHIIECRLGKIEEGVNNRKTYMPDGSGPILFEMPKVANNYTEFLQMCKERSVGAEGALG
jgi:hypothetical protein